MTSVIMQDWQYPRNKLIYTRELGEGQFGKVLLMKAQVIHVTMFVYQTMCSDRYHNNIIENYNPCMVITNRDVYNTYTYGSYQT